MFKIKPSIQKKVKYGYYICLVLIIFVSLMSYLNLKRIERKVAFSFVISELFDTTLEMRRFEKNCFLYGDKKDYIQAIKFTEKAESLLQNNRDAIKKLSINTDIYALENEIKKYKSLMERHLQVDKKLKFYEANTLKKEIRSVGKNIVTATETISTVEKHYIQMLINSSKKVLILSIIMLVVVGWLIVQYLSRMVVRPLKHMENCMQSIAKGEFDAYSTLCGDLPDSEIVSLNKAFNRMLRELEARRMKSIVQSEKLLSLGTMVSGIAHQLNNPLSNVSTSCQILQEEIEQSDIKYKRNLLRQIEEQVDRAKRMVHSLLEFSKKKEFKTEQIPLSALIEDTIRLIKGDIPSKVEMSVNVPDTICVTVDKHRIEQSLLNIIKNAIDAIPEEGNISISADEDIVHKIVEIRIQDTGTGIEQDDLKKIFEPFFTTKDDEKGSGLGLFVAREIIEEHGGRIEVESVPAQGTTFSIKLPLKES